MAKKVIVAVHGIGEQFRYATAQQVVNRFCGYYHEGRPSAVPLGALHRRERPVPAPFPFPENSDLGFEEVYSAPIPRKEATDGFVIEEAKAWARTVVARLGRETGTPPLTHYQYESVRTTLEGIIEAIGVLERLSFLAEKAGVFEFELGGVLTDFIGDVQVVTEYETIREAILGDFDRVMTAVANSPAYAGADIHVVSHSEGTVVALLGLLRGFSALSRPDGTTGVAGWAKQVKGFMTLGSPIDKHIVLWPDLWKPFGKGPAAAALPAGFKAIRWKNYYDNGDPVGFDLDVARKWIKATGWDGVFEFEEKDDHGFTRYYLPGKAHVDYWADPAVFGHYIQHVVEAGAAASPTAKRFEDAPRSRVGALITSYLVPYALVLGLTFLASYLLYKTAYQAIDAEAMAADKRSVGVVFRKVGAMTLLLFGITAGARLVFLTRARNGLHWWVTGALTFAAGAAAYHQLNVGRWLGEGAGIGGFPSTRSTDVGGYRPATVVVAAAALVYLAGAIAGKVKARWGLRALLIVGAGVVTLAVLYLAGTTDREVSLWPIVLAGVGALYLWWLAILVFDLTFVWHRYIRHSRTLGYLSGVWDKVAKPK